MTDSAMLDEKTVPPDPLNLFRTMFERVNQAGQPEANAMTLSTVSLDGGPTGRVVLLKEVNDAGMVFFTNYHSHKGREIEQNPRVSLVFWWQLTDWQVRVEGKAEKISSEDSEAYFATRPRESRLGAWASEQSEQVLDRATLEEQVRRIEERFEGKPVPRPPHWGGYLVRPRRMEFMERRLGRMHDRILYTLQDDGTWSIVRLSP
jgi:pyridoxamine 5'-phosphate oxidase